MLVRWYYWKWKTFTTYIHLSAIWKSVNPPGKVRARSLSAACSAAAPAGSLVSICLKCLKKPWPHHYSLLILVLPESQESVDSSKLVPRGTKKPELAGTHTYLCIFTLITDRSQNRFLRRRDFNFRSVLVLLICWTSENDNDGTLNLAIAVVVFLSYSLLTSNPLLPKINSISIPSAQLIADSW